MVVEPTPAWRPLSEKELTAEQIDTIMRLDGTQQSWSFIRNPSDFSEKPADAPGTKKNLIHQYGGIFRRPAEGKKVIYITHDHGYELGTNTSKLLDIAKEKGVHLNCFVTGNFIDRNPEVVLRMVREGHLVGNHSYVHLDQAQHTSEGTLQTIVNDMVNVAKRFKALTGQEMAPYMRPPQGRFTERSLAMNKMLGYTPVFWSFGYKDWEVDNQPDVAASLKLVSGSAFNGSVLLLHSVSNTNVELLGPLIDDLRARGYEIRRLDE